MKQAYTNIIRKGGKPLAMKGSKNAPIPECTYGLACTRKGCIYKHPKTVVSTGVVCKPFLAGICEHGKACRNIHPGQEEAERLRQGYKMKPCAFADECRTVGCLYGHPQDFAAADEGQQQGASGHVDEELEALIEATQAWQMTSEQEQIYFHDEQQVWVPTFNEWMEGGCCAPDETIWYDPMTLIEREPIEVYEDLFVYPTAWNNFFNQDSVYEDNPAYDPTYDPYQHVNREVTRTNIWNVNTPEWLPSVSQQNQKQTRDWATVAASAPSPNITNSVASTSTTSKQDRQQLPRKNYISMPQTLWSLNTSGNVFHIKDPFDRYETVNEPHTKRNVPIDLSVKTTGTVGIIDLHYQSTKTVIDVLEVKLGEALGTHAEVWIITGTGHHTNMGGGHQKSKPGGVLFNIVYEYLDNSEYKYYVGKDKNGYSGAFLIVP